MQINKNALNFFLILTQNVHLVQHELSKIWCKFELNYLITHQIYFHIHCSPSDNHMEKADFLYFDVEAPNGINLIMFRDSIAWHFLQRSEKN